MSRSPHRPPAEPAQGGAPAPGLTVVVLSTLAVLVTAADTYVVVLALPDILTGVGVGLDELQRATPIVGGFLLGYTATLPLLGRLADLRGRGPVLVGCLLRLAVGALLAAPGDTLQTFRHGRPRRTRARRPGHRRRRTRPRDAGAGRRPLAAGAPGAAPGRRRRGAGG